MADNITGNRFIINDRVPAWHGKGITHATDVLTAREAYEKIGTYKIITIPVTVDGQETGDRAIVREPIPEDDQRRYFGYIGPKYTLITPEEAVAIWDEHSTVKVDTMGVLGLGERFFINRQEDPITVDGDEVRLYTLLDLPVMPGRSASILITGVRTVCQNTLQMAIKEARENWQIVHNASAKIKLGEWLAEAFGRTERKRQSAQELFDTLARHRIANDGEIDYILAATFPEPNRPRNNCPPLDFQKKLEGFERVKTRQEKRREIARELIMGAGTGLADRPLTGWIAYNGAAEAVERHSMTRGAVGAEVLFGDRGTWIANACQAALDVATGSMGDHTRFAAPAETLN